MKKRLLALLLVIALLCPMLAVGASADYTVYITDTGEKYHNYGCRYLSESCRPISASSARAMGYTPCSVCNAPSAEPEQTGFVDVAPNKYYTEAVDWAVEKGVTNGLDKSHFGPQQPCTRGQIVTFLWRAAGEPTVNAEMTFDDVRYGDYCYNAVRWAVKNGITKRNEQHKILAPAAVYARPGGNVPLSRGGKPQCRQCLPLQRCCGGLFLPQRGHMGRRQQHNKR